MIQSTIKSAHPLCNQSNAISLRTHSPKIFQNAFLNQWTVALKKERLETLDKTQTVQKSIKSQQNQESHFSILIEKNHLIQHMHVEDLAGMPDTVIKVILINLAAFASSLSPKQLIKHIYKITKGLLPIVPLLLQAQKVHATGNCFLQTATDRFQLTEQSGYSACFSGISAQKMDMQFTQFYILDFIDNFRDQYLKNSSNFSFQSCHDETSRSSNLWSQSSCLNINKNFFRYFPFCNGLSSSHLSDMPSCEAEIFGEGPCSLFQGIAYRTNTANQLLILSTFRDICKIMAKKTNVFEEIEALKTMFRQKTCDNLQNARLGIDLEYGFKKPSMYSMCIIKSTEEDTCTALIAFIMSVTLIGGLTAGALLTVACRIGYRLGYDIYQEKKAKQEEHENDLNVQQLYQQIE